jgi:hypothetical protein
MRPLILLLSLVIAFGVVAQDEPTTLEETVLEQVAEVPGLREVLLVEITSETGEDGEKVALLSVMYRTAETSEFAYRAEILDVFRSVASVLDEDTTDVERVELLPAVTIDTVIESVLADLDDLLALADGSMTRTAFLAELDVTAIKAGEDDEADV